MKDSNKGVSLFVSFSWVAAISLVVLWAFSIIGSWGIGVAVWCVFAPYVLTAISSAFVAIAVILGRKNK